MNHLGDLSRQETQSAPPAPPIPERIGGYRIVRKIGEGGMGVVFEAEQQHPRRPVALKVIRGGRYVDEHQVRLFQREAQTLARLKHPGIAAIYESGRTEDGQHFFAMELVRGETLSQHLRKRAATAPADSSEGGEGTAGGRRSSGAGASAAAQIPLPPAEVRYRLRLMQRLCDAVAYAHQRGVIHRDLKPSNVLVSRDSGPPSPGSTPGSPSVAATSAEIKILDFGLARITDADVQMSTVLTDAGAVQGTIPYMSPEQVRGNPDEIDLRTDVYSLGVIIHEALSGRLPLPVLRLSLPEAARVICERPPEPLTKSAPPGQKVDADLATIVAKALEKEPSRRYQSATALGNDIERYLANQPILARPASTAYQLRKLISRNRAAFASGVAALVMLVGFAAAMTVQAERIARARDAASREAETAKQVSEFLVGLFEVTDPFEARGNTITAREILDRGAEKIERELKGQPLVQARMMDTMGNVYRSLGLYRQAESLLARAAETREDLLGPSDEALAESLVGLARVRNELGRHDEAVEMLLRALRIRESALGPTDLRVGWTLYHLGWAQCGSGQYAEGGRTYDRAQSIFEQRLGADHWAVAWCLHDKGIFFQRQGDFAAALPLHRRALALKERNLGPDHPDVAITLNGLAEDLARLGDFAAATTHVERSLAMFEKAYGPDHPMMGYPLSTLGEIMRLEGRFEEARRPLERTIALWETTVNPDAPTMGILLESYARVLQALGETRRAEESFRRSIAIKENTLTSSDLGLAGTLEGYAALLSATGRPSEAEPLQGRARSLRAGGGGPPTGH